jgi:Nuclear RNA-splicing-associated protein
MTTASDGSANSTDEDRHRRRKDSKRQEKKRRKKEERSREKKSRTKKDRKRKLRATTGASPHSSGSSGSRNEPDDKKSSAAAATPATDDRLKSSVHGKRRKVDQIETNPMRGDERKESHRRRSEKGEPTRTSAAITSCHISHQSWVSEEPGGSGTTNGGDPPPRNRMTPMSKAEWEVQHNLVRAVVDPATGRTRMMRGTGEIIESIVSRAQHQAINQMATRGDGDSFARASYREGRRRTPQPQQKY